MNSSIIYWMDGIKNIKMYNIFVFYAKVIIEANLFLILANLPITGVERGLVWGRGRRRGNDRDGDVSIYHNGEGCGGRGSYWLCV